MLPIVPFETHAAAKALTAAGASEKIAVAVVEVAQEAAAEHGRELATRADVARLSVELAATRTDIETVREATRADVAELRAELAATRTDIEATRADVARLSVEIAATRTDVETVRAGIETVREATRADVAELRTEQARMENPARQSGCRDRAGHRGAGRRGPAVAVMTMRLRRTGCAQDRQPV